jgi:uncharacterized membrane protein
MAQAAADNSMDLPRVRRIGISHLTAALSLGIDDFKSFWFDSVFLLAIIIPLATMIIAIGLYDARFLHLIFPLISGLSLVAPVATIVFYQQSRWREQSDANNAARRAVYAVSGKAVVRILTLAMLLFGILAAWLLVADGLYQMYFDGVVALSPTQFFDQIFNTREGADMAVMGALVGLFFASVVFCLSVTSFPMLIDQDVGVAMAMATSIKVVATNPRVMAYWALFIAGCLFVACLPLLLGLAIVLPVLGHSSWHLYRSVVGNAV